MDFESSSSVSGLASRPLADKVRTVDKVPIIDTATATDTTVTSDPVVTIDPIATTDTTVIISAVVTTDSDAGRVLRRSDELEPSLTRS